MLGYHAVSLLHWELESANIQPGEALQLGLPESYVSDRLIFSLYSSSVSERPKPPIF
jgi:hypothetical protein